MESPQLEWTDENQKKRHLEIVDRVFIGRTCRGIDETRRVIVDHPMVSRDHAGITFSGSHLEIRDLSKNGTWVNEVRLTAGATQRLAHGDVIRLGETEIYVMCPDISPFGQESDLSSTQTEVMAKEVIVTNLVADVRGFSALSQTEESYQLYELMKELFEAFTLIVHDHKGTVKDYAGDAVYAFWDHDFAPRKEQAALACQTALKQAQAVHEIRAQQSQRKNPAFQALRLGWGLTTGKVTLSHYGSRVPDLALVGDSTNLAFRFSALANKDLPAEIVMCSRTAGLVRDTLEMEDLGIVQVRGRSCKEHVFGISTHARMDEKRHMLLPLPAEPELSGSRSAAMLH